ncbi:MAG: hypothetical protein NTV33_12030, partial [Coprothermobacterota bacterium]|nr:hypothetical protein [Coprothermobacterota bacterium]
SPWNSILVIFQGGSSRNALSNKASSPSTQHTSFCHQTTLPTRYEKEPFSKMLGFLIERRKRGNTNGRASVEDRLGNAGTGCLGEEQAGGGGLKQL